MLKSVVKEFDEVSVLINDEVSAHYNSDENPRAVLYVCIEGNSAISNRFAIMTVNEDFFAFYVVTMLSKPPFQLKHISYKTILRYDSITKLKARKFLIWQNIKMFVNEDGDKYKLKLMISSKTVWIEEQKKNLLLLMDFIEEKGLKE